MLKSASGCFIATTILSLSLITPASAADKILGVYTELDAKKCSPARIDKQTGSSSQYCPGIAKHRLLVEDADARQTVTVITPDGRSHPLYYSQVITGGFSTLGQKAEWRMAQVNGNAQPIALIIRVNANENPQQPEQKTSWLAVAKITANEVCVTDRIPNGSQMNEDARRAADNAATKPCLKH